MKLTLALPFFFTLHKMACSMVADRKNAVSAGKATCGAAFLFVGMKIALYL